MSWFSASELAALALADVPRRRETCSRWIDLIREDHPTLVRPRRGRGGGNEVHIDALPAAARAELDRRAPAAGAGLPPAEARQILPADPRRLTGRQRRVMEARAAVLAAIDLRMAIDGKGRPAAIEATLADIASGRADDDLAAAAAAANDRTGAGRCLSRTAVYRWIANRRDHGIAALAPRSTRGPEPLPDWFEAFMAVYATPQKPSISASLRRLAQTLPDPKQVPTAAAVRRALAKLGSLDRHSGREGRLTLRARMAYVRRDTSDLLPTTIYVADGTTFDAEVCHPIHGRPFKPEVTTIIDAATRRIVGWSAGLSESAWVVADAMRRAASAGIPAVFYTDRGRGYVNETLGDALSGMLARLGTTPMRALPYNSQAKGLVEAVQKLWIDVAKTMPTYSGRDMDKQARQSVFRQTRRDVAFVGRSPLLPEWTDFVAAVEEAVRAYNDRPHRGLPRYRDPVTGSRRHQSPNERWNAAFEAGFEAIVPTPAELDDLFRPYEVRRCRRAIVQIGTNSYFSPLLEGWHERDVLVGYDILDGSRVWVREIDLVDGVRHPGALIAVAEFEGNSTRYIPVSAEQRAMERRASGRLRRLQDKLDRVEEELRPAARLTLVRQPDAAEPAGHSPPQLENPLPLPLPPPTSDTGRPIFADDASFAAWVIGHPDQASKDDRELLIDLLTTQSTREVLRLAGLDMTRLAEIARSAA